MAYILHFDTATRVCSVGLSKDNQLISLKEDKSLQYSHSTYLTTYAQEVLNQAGISFGQLSAVAVSMGPGSYTGLRIGVSAAKGICYALDLPLVSLNSLLVLAHLASNAGHQADFFVPMIDARRMEVYNAIYDNNLREVRKTQAEIIDTSSFLPFLEKGRTLFFGDGSAKCKETITHPNAVFISDIQSSVQSMPQLAFSKYQSKEFEDIAYFEPFYLKDFVAGKPSVKGLR